MRASLIFLFVGGCGASLILAKPTTLRSGEPVVFFGLDFTGAELTDPYFRPYDLERSKIPQWNSNVSNEALADFEDLPIAADLHLSAARNGTIDPLVKTPPRSFDASESTFSREVAPYLDRGAGGKGILVVVERVTKLHGVWAHAILFDRTTGEVLAVARSSQEGDGWGVYQFYRSALRTVVQRCAHAIRNRVSRSS